METRDKIRDFRKSKNARELTSWLATEGTQPVPAIAWPSGHCRKSLYDTDEILQRISFIFR